MLSFPAKRRPVLLVAIAGLWIGAMPPPASPLHEGDRQAAGSAAPQIICRVWYAEDRPGLVRVRIATASALAAPQAFVMPRAIPMGYGDQPYDRFVRDLSASGPAGEAVAVSRGDGPRWNLGAAGGPPIQAVSYTVDLAAMEKEIVAASDASKARSGYVGLLGYSVFGYFDGRETAPVRLEIEGPAGWPILTTLAPSLPAPSGVAAAAAPDFYALADSQIVMGPGMRLLRRDAGRPGGPSIPLFVALYAEAETDAGLLLSLAAEALERVAAYFDTVPFAHYTVQYELLKPLSDRHEYGFSMEHLDSSTYYLGVGQALGPSATAQDRARILYNFAHHVAHAWVPKRAYGEGYFPFTWEVAPVLDTIWFAEGFGQYAAIAALAEGRADGEAFRARMLEARFRQPLAAAPAFLRAMPLVQLSRVASTRYSSDFRTGRTTFARGGLMAAEMDEAIRAATGGSRSLRDGLRALVAWSARERRAFRIDELPGIITGATGVDVRRIVERWLAPLP